MSGVPDVYRPDSQLPDCYQITRSKLKAQQRCPNRMSIALTAANSTTLGPRPAYAYFNILTSCRCACHLNLITAACVAPQSAVGQAGAIGAAREIDLGVGLVGCIHAVVRCDSGGIAQGLAGGGTDQGYARSTNKASS